MGKSTQKAIVIDENLWQVLDQWIESGDAKKKGYHSKAQFATEAIREKLEEYTTRKRKSQNDETNIKLDLIFKMLAILTKQTLRNKSGSEDSFSRLKKKIEVAFKENAKYYTDKHQKLPEEKSNELREMFSDSIDLPTEVKTKVVKVERIGDGKNYTVTNKVAKSKSNKGITV